MAVVIIVIMTIMLKIMIVKKKWILPFCWISAEDWIDPRHCIAHSCPTFNIGKWQLVQQIIFNIQGVFFHWSPPKKLKNGKPRLRPSWWKKLAPILLLLCDQIGLDHLSKKNIRTVLCGIMCKGRLYGRRGTESIHTDHNLTYTIDPSTI